MFRKYFDRRKADKRSDELRKVSGIGSESRVRGRAIMAHRSFWPKTPYMPEDDVHEQGFIDGYCSRESEVETLREKVRHYEILLLDYEEKILHTENEKKDGE